MDDDAPLSALAKAPKFDDDTPLASLADVKPRAGAKAGAKAGSPAGKVPPKGSPKAAPPAAKGRGKGKPTPTKRKAGSSSSSSSSDSDSSSSDSDAKAKSGARKKVPLKGQKKKMLQKIVNNEDGLENVDGGGAVKKRDRSVKEQVVADLLCRWWYALPPWPPQDEAYYQAELAKRSFRKVTIQEWEWVQEEDAKGHKKVYELSQFRGLFRASNGDLVDARPKDTCPCYANLVKKDLPDLYDLLVTALENQMKDLKNSKYNETQLEQELKVRLTSAREKAYQARTLSGAAKKGGKTG